MKNKAAIITASISLAAFMACNPVHAQGQSARYPAQATRTAPVQVQAPVKIAIIDTGYFGETEYEDVTFANFNSRSRDEMIQPAALEQRGYSSLHGTWVAGVVLDRMSVPANVISYRSERNCRGDHCDLDVINIVRAAKDAARNGAEIIQISSYGDFGAWGNQEMAKIAASGVHVVICAGNDRGLSPLLDMAALDKDRIHIVGSLTRRGRKSSFSARDQKDSPLLKWRQGEDLRTYSPHGRTIRVTGTSYAASVFTAELANTIYAGRQRPAPQVATAIAQIIKPQAVIVEAEADEATISNDRVDLAASGEMPVEKLTPTERIRLRSRAIRPTGEDEIRRPAVIAPSEKTTPAPAVTPQRPKSRARPPEG